MKYVKVVNGSIELYFLISELQYENGEIYLFDTSHRNRITISGDTCDQFMMGFLSSTVQVIELDEEDTYEIHEVIK